MVEFDPHSEPAGGVNELYIQTHSFFRQEKPQRSLAEEV